MTLWHCKGLVKIGFLRSVFTKPSGWKCRRYSNVETVEHVLSRIRSDPFQFLVTGFNWKTALWSALIRSMLFCAILFRGGWRAAIIAMSAEALFRIVVSGLFGSIMQALRNAQPQWQAFFYSAVVLPGIVQIAEYGVHCWMGTSKLFGTTIASLVMTVVAGLFQWHAMRRGAMLVGVQSLSFAEEMKAIPGLVGSFLFGEPSRSA